MEVKIYLEDEKLDTVLSPTENEEWKALIESLGLKGQETFKESKSIMPFKPMNIAEKEILQTIFNEETEVREFAYEIIPLRILSIIAFCEKEKYFDELKIWSSRINPDPFLIGKKYKNEEDRKEKRTWNMMCYLLARWGEKLLTMEEMLPIYYTMKKNEIEENYIFFYNILENNYKKYKELIKLSQI